MLLARVKINSPYKTVTACAGKLFVKTEWLQVPADREDEARRNPFLDVDEPKADEPEPQPEQLPASDPGTDATPTDATDAEIVPEQPEPPAEPESQPEPERRTRRTSRKEVQ